MPSSRRTDRRSRRPRSILPCSTSRPTPTLGGQARRSRFDAILKLAPANNGNWIVCAGKAMYRLVLVPGIPGFDLRAVRDLPRKPE
jgi:hypothetical protein